MQKRRLGLLVALGATGFLLFLIVLLPATALLRFLPPELAASGLSGTVWRGRAEQLAYRGQSLGALEWRGSPLSLLTGSLRHSVRWQPSGGELTAELVAGFRGRIRATGIAGQVPMTALSAFGVSGGWNGRLVPALDAVTLQQGQLRELTGQLALTELVARDGARLGAYELNFATASDTGAVSGRVRDRDGPLRVRGALTVAPNGDWKVTGDVAPGPTATQQQIDALAFLGPPDASGRRPLALEGTL